MRSLIMAALCSLCLVALSAASFQERGEAGRKEAGRPASKQTITEATERLRRSVNGKAIVRNHCQSEGRDVLVEESTEISEIEGCSLILKTRKTTTLGDGRREQEITLHADLAALTMPASVERQSFLQCKPVEGDVLKVMTRAQPGKTIRATRRSSSNSSTGASKTEDPEVQTTRSDISFFFGDALTARKAALALNQALKACGGTEWPDDDDLP